MSGHRVPSVPAPVSSRPQHAGRPIAPSSRRRVVEADVCIVGGGITAAMVAEKLSDEREARIAVVEAGQHSVPLEERMARRRRSLDYGENPWLRDHVEDQSAAGIMSRSMVVGGQALHWGGVTTRFTPEDFRVHSLYGVGADWPIDYDDLKPYYQEAEERIGVSGEQGPPELDPRSWPYPMPHPPLLEPPSAQGMDRRRGDPHLGEPGGQEHRPLAGEERLPAL